MCLYYINPYQKKTKVKTAYKIMAWCGDGFFSGFKGATNGINLKYVYPPNQWVYYKSHEDSCSVGLYSFRSLKDAVSVYYENSWNFVRNHKLVICSVRISDILYEGTLLHDRYHSYISRKMKLLSVIEQSAYVFPNRTV